jgi:hypothetical protein
MVQDLSPLQGMPLVTLTLRGCPVRDLTPLAGMPINSLDLVACNELSDLTPLAGIPLKDIGLAPANFTNDSLAVLRQCKTLQTVIVGLRGQDQYTARDFWQKFDAGEFKP